MVKLVFEQGGKKYEVWGRYGNPQRSIQAHIFDLENQIIPMGEQRNILQKYLLENGFSKEELAGKTTHQLVYITRKCLLSISFNLFSP